MSRWGSVGLPGVPPHRHSVLSFGPATTARPAPRPTSRQVQQLHGAEQRLPPPQAPPAAEETAATPPGEGEGLLVGQLDLGGAGGTGLGFGGTRPRQGESWGLSRLVGGSPAPSPLPTTGLILQQRHRFHHVSQHHHSHAQHGYGGRPGPGGWEDLVSRVPGRHEAGPSSRHLASLHREVQLPGHLHRGSEQRAGRWRHLHRLHHEGWGCGG